MRITKEFKHGIETFSMEGQLQEQKVSYSYIYFEGAVKIAEINTVNNLEFITKKITVSVFNIKNDEASKPISLLRKGDVFKVIQTESELTFTMNGLKLADNILEPLNSIFTTSDQNSDDRIFGVQEMKKVGDSWKINKKAILRELSLEGIKSENLHGDVSLKEIKKNNDIDCLHLVGNLRSNR